MTTSIPLRILYSDTNIQKYGLGKTFSTHLIITKNRNTVIKSSEYLVYSMKINEKTNQCWVITFELFANYKSI